MPREPYRPGGRWLCCMEMDRGHRVGLHGPCGPGGNVTKDNSRCWGNDSKLWLWKISSRASTSCCKKLIWSKEMNYSMRNHHILILFTCWCALKDPWFKALLSLLFSRPPPPPPINADLLSSTSPLGWHLKGIDLLGSDCPNYSGTSKARNCADANNPALIFPFRPGTSALETFPGQSCKGSLRSYRVNLAVLSFPLESPLLLQVPFLKHFGNGLRCLINEKARSRCGRKEEESMTIVNICSLMTSSMILLHRAFEWTPHSWSWWESFCLKQKPSL